MVLRDQILLEAQYSEPYIDRDEKNSEGKGYRYIHGGFKHTEIRFSMYFPEASNYRKRFIHFILPITGSEDSSKGLSRIDFALEQGAYFVESNMGGLKSVGESVYKASAAVAQFSRKLAAQIYGEHVPYGYVYGGSGGAFKTVSCVQCTDVWDGSVPLVMGSPMAMPNVFTVRAHAFRILRHKLDQIADAMEPGGKDTVFRDMTEVEKEAFDELSSMGFPKKVWFAHESMKLGALPVFIPMFKQFDPQYFVDFWTIPGYLGADPKGSAVKDRIFYTSKIEDCFVKVHEVTEIENESVKEEAGSENSGAVIKTGVDDAWQNLKGIDLSKFQPWVVLEKMPTEKDYLVGAVLKITSGKFSGRTIPVRYLKENKLYIDEGFNMPELLETIESLRRGDELILDNSDFIAIQTYHRHQVPDGDYPVWDQFKNKDGKPKYPQRSSVVGPMLSYGGSGSIQDGSFHGKMIVVDALMDESAFPWQGDWYKKRVLEQTAGKSDDTFRLWFVENAMHGDHDKEPDTLHVAGYTGAECQALCDLIRWVEKGIEPSKNSIYKYEDGQITVPQSGYHRGGIQHSVVLTANGERSVTVVRDESITFEATIEIPEGTGHVTSVAWSFDGRRDFPIQSLPDAIKAVDTGYKVQQMYSFERPGTYFGVVSISVERDGNRNKPYTQIKNLDRVRIIVKE